MTSATLIFPHQLFEQHPALVVGDPVFLLEEYLFFKLYPFHKKKLILHRASMKAYKLFLEKKGFRVEYIEDADVRTFIPSLVKQGFNHLNIAEVVDNWLLNRIQKTNINITFHRTPYFLNSMKEVEAFFSNKKTYFQTDFYISQRKQRNILIDEKQKPTGGQWTFDADNRKKFPKHEIVPTISAAKDKTILVEATAYIENKFPHNPGNTAEFFYPVQFSTAQKWLTDFLIERFEKFGIYEDAMVSKENILHHSVLSPLINIGILTPDDVLNQSIQYAMSNQIPLNSLEGFVRQILGWREFIRIVYEREGVKQRTTNYFGFKRKIPRSFWSGTTGIIPVDTVIHHTLQDGYTHHINRLMVLGNFMLLCEFDPDEVYRWFMEMFTDAYDWVMVPNVYGMTQFADGGLMTTKPYISGSNYLMKMGDWPKGEWQAIWDGLFWRFMHIQRDLFSKNPRMGMLLKTFDKMETSKRHNLLKKAEDFLTQMDTHAKTLEPS